ncbi:MAG: ribokinase family sugar kinase [Rhodobacteraceae bacterium HLUCCA08]|nr:MAG: ribokinase family sugar kinase [Rhodobacteraceae bacterium HLUCCA08]
MTAPAPIAIIGNANLDLVGGTMDHWPERGTESFLDHSDLRIGGSAANTALVLQRLQARSGLIASAGGDLVGDMIAGRFGGALDRIARVAGPSSVTFGLLHPGSERTFFSTPGHLDRFDLSLVRGGLADWPLAGAMALVSGSFALPALCRGTSELLSDLRGHGAALAIDPGWPDGGWTEDNRALALDWIAQGDVILMNDKEVQGLTGCATVAAALDRLDARLRPGAVLAVKCGPAGAVGRHGGDTLTAPSPPAEVLDTIGAGDAFNAGYLAAWQAGYPVAGCLRAGCDIASRVIRDFPRGTGPLALTGLSR